MKSLPPASRRRFLQIACGATVAAGAACLGCSSAGASPDPIGDVDAGNVKDLPSGTLRAVRTIAVAIGRDGGGVYAMTLTCTHSACNMAVSGSVTVSGVHCACHGSAFDVNGGVTSGPAEHSLQHFAVTADANGELTIHGGQNVDASTRLKV